MPTKKKTRRVLAAAGVSVLTALAVWTAWGNTALQCNAYTVSSPRLPAPFDGCRIAHISDLHNGEMGEGNEALLALLRQAAPDVIAITGDLIDSRRTDVAVALAFAAQAVQIAPCYYITGNHEARVPAEYAALKTGLTALGVTVLENERSTLTRDGQTLTILGVKDPSFQTGDQPGDTAAVMAAQLQELVGEGEGFTVLLSHRPELFATYAGFGVDLVLTGHAHGGQFRLPFVGGVLAPNQGFFPPYDAGAYTQGETTMLVSRGIGNSLFPFRFNNRPEILLVELRRQATP